LVGPCRRVHRGVHTWPSPGPIRAALPRVLPDEGVFGFDTEGRRSYATGGFHVDR
jgi:hypothetical protein